MPWTEEAALDTTWTGPTLGAFQRNAFQTNAFQVADTLDWVQEAEVDDTWTEEAEL